MERRVPSLEAAEARESLERVPDARTASSESGVGIDSRVAVGVLELAFLLVREDFVRFRGFFEFIGGRFVVLLDVRDVCFGRAMR